MLLKQNMIILITVMGLITLSCVDVPSTAPELTETLEAAKASAKTDEVIDVKTFEENTVAKSNERKNLIMDQENK